MDRRSFKQLLTDPGLS